MFPFKFFQGGEGGVRLFRCETSKNTRTVLFNRLENISTQGECDAGDRVEEQAEWGAKPGKPGIIIITIRDLHRIVQAGEAG